MSVSSVVDVEAEQSYILVLDLTKEEFHRQVAVVSSLMQWELYRESLLKSLNFHYVSVLIVEDFYIFLKKNASTWNHKFKQFDDVAKYLSEIETTMKSVRRQRNKILKYKIELMKRYSEMINVINRFSLCAMREIRKCVIKSLSSEDFFRMLRWSVLEQINNFRRDINTTLRF